MSFTDSKKKYITFFISLILITVAFLSSLKLGPYVIILLSVFLIWMSYIEDEKKTFTSFGFKKKNANYKNLLVYAPTTAFVILIIYRYLLAPIVTKFTGVPIDISSFDFLRGNLSGLISILGFVWVSAAFGEEIIFRGYLMTRFSKIFGTSTLSIIFNVLIFAAFFGFIHAYQGITGQILSGLTGAMIAVLFHLKKNDLWFCIVVHGMIDTLAFIAIYFNIF